MASGIKWRPATVDEAVESIMRCILRESRVQQLAWFREHQGDMFSEQVKKIVQQKWKKNGK